MDEDKHLRWFFARVCDRYGVPLLYQSTGGNECGGGGVGGRPSGDVPLSGACHSAAWKRQVGDAVTLNGKFNKDNGSGSAE